MAIQINGSTGVSGVNGTGANPVYSGGDSDTGIFFPALGQVAITTNGVQRLLIAETGDIQSASVLSFPGGSASAPSIAFTGDTDTGLYSPSANSVAISTGGSGRLFVDANGNVGVGAAPVVVFAGQTHLTVNHSSGGTTVAGINLATDGTRRASLITYPSNSEALRITAESTTLPITVHTNGSERLRITSAGLVGVGTSSPSKKVEIANGDVRLTDGYTISWGDDAWRIFRNGSQLRFDANGTQALTIDSSQRVGIGTTSPYGRLDIGSGDMIIHNGLLDFRTGDNVSRNMYIASDGTAGQILASVANLRIGAASNTIFEQTGVGERARIDSSGRLLVGTSSTSAAARVLVSGGDGARGVLNIASTSATPADGDDLGFISFNDSSHIYNNALIRAQRDGGTWTATTSKPTRLTFSTTADGASSPTERMRIDSSGRVGIGTTSPSTNLHVLGGGPGVDAEARISSNQNGAFLSFAPAGTNTIRQYAIGSAVGGSLIFFDNTASSQRAAIDSSGRLLVGASSTSENTTLLLQGFNGTRTDGGGHLRLAIPTATPVSGANLGVVLFSDSTHADCAVISADRDGGTWSASSKPTRLVFATTADGASSSTERMRIAANGQITHSLNGTTNAANLTLNVGGVGDPGNAGWITPRIDFVGSSLASPGTTFIGATGGLGGRSLVFATGSDGAGSERVRIDSSGSLLVGTSSGRNIGTVYQHKLQIETTQYAGLSIVNNTADTGPALLVLAKSRGTSVGSVNLVQANDVLGSLTFAGADGTDIETPGASIEAYVDGTPGANDMPGRLVFSTTADGASSPTERMRIGQNGYIQCSETGTYSPDGGSVWHKFYQSVNERCLQTYNTAGTFTNYALTQYIAAGGGTGSGFASGFSDSGSIQRYIIFSNGNIQNTNNSYGAISDLKLKENIVDASEQWNDIKNLRVRKYNLKQGGAHTQIGVIAQEIELVSPGLVYETTDRDTDGNDLGTVTKSVNYSVLYMKAVKALQEAMERIETLEAENAHQKASLTDILSRISALEGA